MKNILLLTLLSLLGLTANPDQHSDDLPFTVKYVIKGKVITAYGEALKGATVYNLENDERTLTDDKGFFSFTTDQPCIAVKVTNGEAYSTAYELSICEKTSNEIVLKAKNPNPPSHFFSNSETYEAQPAPANMARKRSMSLSADSYALGAFPASGDAGIAMNTEDYGIIKENKFLKPTDDPLSTFSIDVDAASYSNLRRFIQSGQKPPRDAVRIEEMVNYFNYEHEAPTGEHPFAASMEMADCPWSSDHKLLQISLQGEKIPYEDLPASNLVFLIDVSGSMSAQNKLPLLVSSFKLLAKQLRPEDKVSIVVYAGAAGVVLEPTNDKEKIKKALEQLSAGGSTAGGEGIQKAYALARENFVEGGNNRVILATDGDFNVGTSSDAGLVRMIEKERESGIFLTVLGFGMGNYKDNKMQQLANKGNGNHAYIDNINEAKKVLISEFGGTMFTIAKDVKLQIEFNPAKVAGYRLIGYENRLLDKQDFNNDKIDAGELGSGHTVTALYEIIPAGVQSQFLSNVDDLKYQKLEPAKSNPKEWLTLKLRYKKPDDQNSQLLQETLKGQPLAFEKASENLRWAGAVAEFGMLLRASAFVQNGTFNQVLEIAEGAKGEDKEGYRSEFIRMVRIMNDLESPISAGK